MSRTTAKIYIGVWSAVLLLFTALFGYLWYNGGWTGLSLHFGWSNHSTYQQVHEQTFTEPIQTLALDWKGGDVSVFSTSGKEIKIVQKAVKNTPEDQFFQASIEDDALVVSNGKTVAGLPIGPFPLSIGSDLEVYLPEQIYETLQLDTTGGDIFFQPLEVKELVVHTNSGDVSLGGDFEKLDFSSNSGDLLCRDVTVKQLISQTTSGDIQASGSFARIQATSTSGDISLRTSQMITEAAIQSTSGDVVLFIPENDGFTAQLNSSTGDFICAFPDFHGGDTYRYKDGSAKIQLNTTSGDACLLYA
ncbi:MAG: DUF4097 family beta strand repeat-containing protein [Anaeromassilibacillus sp.]